MLQNMFNGNPPRSVRAVDAFGNACDVEMQVFESKADFQG